MNQTPLEESPTIESTLPLPSWRSVIALALPALGQQGLTFVVLISDRYLTGHLPGGADLALEGALGVSGAVAMGLRVLIVAAALMAAFKLRGSLGLVIAVGFLASLLIAPYLHGSDLCLVSVAAWIAWEERPALAWRAPLTIGWLASSPFVDSTRFAVSLRHWTLVELVFFAALVLVALVPVTGRLRSQTGGARRLLG